MTSFTARIERLGGVAAWISSVVALATLLAAFVLIGPEAMMDRRLLLEMAIQDPAPLIVQDVLKFAAAATSSVLIVALFGRLRRDAPTRMSVASAFGFTAVFVLITNATMSLYAIFHGAAMAREGSALPDLLNALVGLSAFLVIVLNGVWYLLVSWTALRGARLPRRLAHLGLVMGGLSLVPPLAVIVLGLSIVWSAWVGHVLRQGSAGEL